MATDKRISTTSIIKRTVILEEITLQGKKVIRERVHKEFKIPEIITDDIGFQLQFGMQSASVVVRSQHSGIKEHNIISDYNQ